MQKKTLKRSRGVQAGWCRVWDGVGWVRVGWGMGLGDFGM